MVDPDSVSLCGSAVFIDNDLAKNDLGISTDSFGWKTNDDSSLNEEFEELSVATTDRLTNLDQISTHREDYTVIWLDPLIDSEDLRTQEIAIKLSDGCKVFNDIAECLDYIVKTTESVILIISGSCATQCLESLHPIKQIDSVIIYCARRENYLWMSNAYKKVVTCVQNEKDLIEHVHRLITVKCQTPFYISKDITGKKTGYLWIRLMQSLLVRMSNTDNAKEEMLGMCRTYYQHNHKVLRKIDEFKATYSPEKAIWWYTRSSFVYKLLNKVLRTENMEAIYHFRTFIADLHSALENTYAITQNSNVGTKALKIYRGKSMSASDLHRLQNNLGSLIITNGFLSASQNRDVALTFARRLASRNYTAMLFEIIVDWSSANSMCFADISQESYFPHEEEVLFGMGAVFQIQSVHYNNLENVWNVTLTSISVSEKTQDLKISEVFPNLCLKQKGLDQNSPKYPTKDFFSDDCVAELADDYFHYMFELKTLYRKIGSNYLSVNTDSYKKALWVHEKAMQIRLLIFSRYTSNCNNYLNSNSSGLSRNVDNSYEEALSIYEQAEKLYYAFYSCYSPNGEDLLLNIDRMCCSKDIDDCTGECLYHQKLKRSYHNFITLSSMNAQNLHQKGRFETPILCFNLDPNQLDEEKEFRTKWFFEFQTIFITDALQITQQVLRCHVNHRQFYLITGKTIPAELKSLKTNSLRVYYLNVNSERDNHNELDCHRLNVVYVKNIEQLVCKLYHDLGQYYNNIAMQLLNEQHDLETAKQWLYKSSRCYELLAQSTKDITDRYQNSLQ